MGKISFHFAHYATVQMVGNEKMLPTLPGYLVSLRTLAVNQGVFHVETVMPQ